MDTQIIFSFLAYFSIIAAICCYSYKQNDTVSDFALGNRSANYWVTAISAHASDMSSWLFMGLPAAILVGGGYKCWAAFGLAFFMFLNWHFVAPRIRVLSESTNSLTLPSLFESHLDDKSGTLRVLSALLSLFFFAFYISSGMVGMGFLFESVFHVNYHLGISVAILMIMIYTFMGGYTTIVITDFFQGLFLLFAIILVPSVAFTRIDGIGSIIEAAKVQGIVLSPLPEMTWEGILQVLLISVGWGLGYFGQPHILNKFMGIENPDEIHKSKYVGMVWHILSLSAATIIGYIGIAYFQNGLENNELIFVEMVQDIFPPLLAGFILCAILAATISTIDSQILVLSSVIEEDIYKKSLRKNASEKELLIVSRISVVLICVLSFCIAYNKSQTVFELVQYAWSGLGSSFGPIVLLTLYYPKLSKEGAIFGLVLGGFTSAFWHTLPTFTHMEILPIIPGFFIGTLAAVLGSKIFPRTSKIV
ncbi:MAG: SSS family solute:Na+ symporter [Chlamydiales bacterium]